MMITHPDMAILFSGGPKSLALYGLACNGHLPSLGRPQRIHLLNMSTGMGSFPAFTRQRFTLGKEILHQQRPDPAARPDSLLVELDAGRLFQGLWLNRHEELLPRFNGKNLACVACQVAMHIQAIIYCTENLIATVAAGYSKGHTHCPEQHHIFLDKISKFSQQFGITSVFPVYPEFTKKTTISHVLEDLGLPATGGGRDKCPFSQTLSTATETEIGNYLEMLLPKASEYIDHRLNGHLAEAAAIFPLGTT